MRLYGAYNDNLDDANKRGNHYSLRRRDTMLVSLFITTPNNAMRQYGAIDDYRNNVHKHTNGYSLHRSGEAAPLPNLFCRLQPARIESRRH